MPQSSEAAQYLPGLAHALILFGSWICVTVTLLRLGWSTVQWLMQRPVKGDSLGLVGGFCLFICSGLLVIFGLSILGVQLFLWAKTDIWSGVPTAAAFWLIGFDLSSVYHGTDWKGLAAAITWLLAFPLSLTSLLIGVFGVWQGEQVMKDSKPPPKTINRAAQTNAMDRL